MQRCREDLHGRGSEELCGCEARDAHALRRVGINVRRKARGHVEGCKDGQAVAERKDGEAGQRDGSRGGGAGSAEELDKGLVLVDAEGDVCQGGGGKLGGSGGGG